MNPATPQPIETRYAGCRFRSRLEARWAVLFDTLGIRWDYEPEGFELEAGWYLPDFRLHGLGDGWSACWFEIKPDDSPGDDPRWSQLADATGINVWVSYGLPRDARDLFILKYMPGGPGMVDLFTPTEPTQTLINPGLTAARSARFEHGETG